MLGFNFDQWPDSYEEHMNHAIHKFWGIFAASYLSRYDMI